MSSVQLWIDDTESLCSNRAIVSWSTCNTEKAEQGGNYLLTFKAKPYFVLVDFVIACVRCCVYSLHNQSCRLHTSSTLLNSQRVINCLYVCTIKKDCAKLHLQYVWQINWNLWFCQSNWFVTLCLIWLSCWLEFLDVR